VNNCLCPHYANDDRHNDDDGDDDNVEVVKEDKDKDKGVRRRIRK
jgi:hypothetical protein